MIKVLQTTDRKTEPCFLQAEYVSILVMFRFIVTD